MAITTIIKYADGRIDRQMDCLFRLPVELSDAPRIAQYEKISRPGWSRGEFGHWNFANRHSSGDLYIYPALNISDLDRPKRKFHGYDQWFSSSQIERYANQMSALISGYQSQVDEEFSLLVHDLRQISASIYHAAEEAKNFIASWATADAVSRIDSIIAAQSMLRLRTDILNYSGNSSSLIESDHIAVYKKVDKVVRCFQPYAATKNLKLHLEGSSFGLAEGPDVFEILPYILIDNAIKYSPRNNDITVRVSELESFVVVRVSSVGPCIDEDEREAIFERGYRGRNALISKAPGSGAGLYLAQQLVAEFGGSLSVEVSQNVYLIDQQKMTDVEFVARIPLGNLRRKYSVVS